MQGLGHVLQRRHWLDERTPASSSTVVSRGLGLLGRGMGSSSMNRGIYKWAAAHGPDHPSAKPTSPRPGAPRRRWAWSAMLPSRTNTHRPLGRFIPTGVAVNNGAMSTGTVSGAQCWATEGR